MNKKEVLSKVHKLLRAYNNGTLGGTKMPEDTHPEFSNIEEKRVYYTFPMALNYQRDSYKLWDSAKKTWKDENTKAVFSLDKVIKLSDNKLRKLLVQYKLALQPNRHIQIWKKLTETFYENWGSVTGLLEVSGSDYLKVKYIVQKDLKKEFPYLSGPKIFNYWMYIMSEYGEVELNNRSFIEIAPDTHVIQATERLGLASGNELAKMNRESISLLWRDLLNGTDIDPIDVHSPLWFWSRSGFKYSL